MLMTLQVHDINAAGTKLTWHNMTYAPKFETREAALAYASRLDPDGLIPPNTYRLVGPAGNVIFKL